ncbi:MAG: sugar phosphate isomerase/epimerase [Nanoarchaeota archaeon]|nr:sugar phosphate isomerase/epimerase [Nanoarchaeota archaeon]
MPYKIAVTSGIYSAARSEELQNAIKKLGYTLTRGVNAVEIAADVAHEVPYSHGVEIRHMAKKQGVEILMHGDLQVPFEIPERGEWRDAQDRLRKSIRSAVYAGATYVNFHACLNIWLELMTYAGRKLTFSFCDEDGHFISKMLKEDAELRKWFIEKKADLFQSDIFTRDERVEIRSNVSIQEENWRRIETEKRIRDALTGMVLDPQTGQKIDAKMIDEIIDSALVRGLTHTRISTIDKTVDRILNDLRTDAATAYSRIEKRIVDEFLDDKLKKGKLWESEELRGGLSVVEGYHLMGRHMFFTNDQQWISMSEYYPEIMAKYKYDSSNKRWIDDAWKKSEDSNDRDFKEFFYAAIAAKYLEGHIKSALKWVKNEFIGKEIASLKNVKERDELTYIANKIIIAIETPDAREPQHAGLYFLFRPKQIHSAVKTIRKVLKTERVMTIIDHEHLATQGLDALKESDETIKKIKDLGEIMICVHANHPNPLQPHAPIEIGDDILYKLLYNLRKTGFGKTRRTYLLFERGGGEDPFKQSVDALRLMAIYLDKETHPDELPLEFYGVKGHVAGNFERQFQIMRDHMYEPMKDLLEMPEEDWTMLSQTVVKKGKRPEVWKKGEFR